jgi:hypoxanthine phosphoribosyltransferase
MRKEFLSFETVRDNGIKLAYRVYREFGIPDVIYVSLRGGAPLGNIMSEYFKIISRTKKVFFAAVVARAYQDVIRCDEVTVDGWTYGPERLKPGDKILLIDDIFDTGRTINHLVKLIMEYNIPRRDIAVVVHDYKIRLYETQLPIQPDFFCRQHVIEKKEDDLWIHYLCHELKSLTDEELAQHFDLSDAALREALAFLKKT